MQLKPLKDGSRIIGTNVSIRKRKGTKNWEIVIYVPEEQKVKVFTSGTEDKDDALRIALEKNGELSFMKKHNIDIFPKKMGKVAEDWVASIKKRKIFSDYMIEVYSANVRLHIVPQLGELSINSVTPEIIDQYVQQIIADGVKAKSSINTHRIAINAIFKFAKENGWYKKEQSPTVSIPKEATSETRAAFTKSEINLIVSGFNRYIEQASSDIHKYNRSLLKAMILFMWATGCRTNDIKKLLWSDIRLEGTSESNWNSDNIIRKDVFEDLSALDDETVKLSYLNGQFMQAILKGKVKENPVAIDLSAIQVLVDWWRISIHKQPNELVFSGFKGGFNQNYTNWFQAYLTELKIPLRVDNESRTPYSIRHTFITQKLIEGYSPFDLAKQCRTSLHHIETTYNKMLPRDLFEKIFKVK